MTHDKFPITEAVRFLRSHDIHFDPYLYAYEEKGGTKASSRALGINEHNVIKTLVMETDTKSPLIILMHGDRNVSLKDLGKTIGVEKISPCSTQDADKYSGYQVGGTSPFGTKTKMPIYLQASVLNLKEIYINGGGRGFLVRIDPQEIVRTLNPVLVDVAVLPKGSP